MDSHTAPRKEFDYSSQRVSGDTELLFTILFHYTNCYLVFESLVFKSKYEINYYYY